MSSGTFNGVDLSVPVNRVAVASVGRQPRVVPAVQRAERHHGLRLPRRVELRLDAAHAEPSDRTPAAVLRRLHVRRRPRARSATNTSTIDPYDPKSHLWRARAGPHARPERVVERVPARRRAGRDEQRVRPRTAERLAAVRHLLDGERHPVSAQLQRRRPAATAISAAYFGTADVVGPSTRRRQRPGARLHVRSAARRNRRRREDARHQLHLACRRSARTATSCRRTTSGTPTRFNHDLTLFKNFDDPGRTEDPVPRRVLQHLQPGVREPVHRQRHQPDASTPSATSRAMASRTAPAARPTTSAIRHGGFSYTPQTNANFGKINLKRGTARHRVRPEVLLLTDHDSREVVVEGEGPRLSSSSFFGAYRLAFRP